MTGTDMTPAPAAVPGASSLKHRRWIVLAKAHWAEFLPRRYAALLDSDALQRELYAAAEMTTREFEALRLAGLSYDEAWQAVRELWLFPPAEQEVDEEELPDCPALDCARLMSSVARQLAGTDYDIEGDSASLDGTLGPAEPKT